MNPTDFPAAVDPSSAHADGLPLLRASGETAQWAHFASDIALKLVQAARRWVKVPPETLAEILAMQRRIKRFLDVVQQDPAVEYVTGFTGGGQRNSANMFMSLKPLAERKVSSDEVINRLRDKLKSPIADMVNSAGRYGGAITAAMFLEKFVDEDTSWIHLDIAGTALLKSDSTLAPKGATGWGVLALNRLIRDRYEVK